jgi:hypothetical protein
MIVSCRLDLLQLGMVEFLSGVTGEQVSWGYAQPSQDQQPSNYVTCTLIGGPSQSGSGSAYGQPIYAPTSIALEIDSTGTSRYGAQINGRDYVYDGLISDSLSDIADGVLASLAADVDALFSAVAVGPIVTITPSSAGSIWSYASIGPATITATLASSATLVTASRRVCQLRIEAFSRSRSPRAGAWAVISKALAGLQSPIATLALAGYGVACWAVGEPIDLTAVDGGFFESRVAFDLYVTIASVSTEPVDRIDTVELGLHLLEPTFTSTIEIIQP